MRRFFNLLRQLIRQCFPNSELKAIGSFLFLRFICPAIIAPNGFNVWDGKRKYLFFLKTNLLSQK